MTLDVWCRGLNFNQWGADMKQNLSRSLRLGAASIAAFAVCQADLTATPAWAQSPVALPPGGPPAPAPAPEPAAPTPPVLAPSLTGPLTANATPFKFEVGPLDTVYVTGVASGLVGYQSSAVTGDHKGLYDISNGQVMIQKIDGPLQFYAQVGAYSLPALGTNYFITQRASEAISNYFGALPVGYAKLVPSDTFSIQAGKLPTLIGAEYTFTFQNMNIERGLLWNQEPAISKGAQANLTTGPVAWSVSFNDGFDSDRYNWITGSATWTIDPANSLVFVGGGNVSHTGLNSIVAPFFQNNENIFNVIYTYNNAPWTITPYFQYTSVPKNLSLGATKGAETYGGAVLANYSINPNWNLAGRVEYISSTGSATDGSPSLLYGPGSSAWSFTVTPTYQQGIFFARAEGSFVGAQSTTAGFAFGRSGTTKSQGRFMLEAGILF
jgi:hypothetical protein